LNQFSDELQERALRIYTKILKSLESPIKQVQTPDKTDHAVNVVEGDKKDAYGT
jgi:hypothetical protein